MNIRTRTYLLPMMLSFISVLTCNSKTMIAQTVAVYDNESSAGLPQFSVTTKGEVFFLTTDENGEYKVGKYKNGYVEYRGLKGITPKQEFLHIVADDSGMFALLSGYSYKMTILIYGENFELVEKINYSKEPIDNDYFTASKYCIFESGCLIDCYSGKILYSKKKDDCFELLKAIPNTFPMNFSFKYSENGEVENVVLNHNFSFPFVIGNSYFSDFIGRDIKGRVFALYEETIKEDFNRYNYKIYAFDSFGSVISSYENVPREFDVINGFVYVWEYTGKQFLLKRLVIQ